MMRNVYVVTHTESQHHLDGVVGRWHDSDLSPRGEEQAARVAQAVLALIPDGAARAVYTSDLRRAVQTATPVAAALASIFRDLGRRRGLMVRRCSLVHGRGFSPRLPRLPVPGRRGLSLGVRW